MKPSIQAFTGTALILAAAHGLAADVDLKQPVPQITSKVPSPVTDMPSDRSVKLTNWKSSVNAGDVIGQRSGGLFCAGTVPLRFTKESNEYLLREVTHAFIARTTALGLAQPAADGSAFDTASSSGSADFRVGATLLAWDYRVCAQAADLKGAAYGKIKWEIYSPRRQKVVWTSISEGSVNLTETVPIVEFHRKLWAAVVNNALADPGFIEAIRSDGMSAGNDAPDVPTLKFSSGAVAVGSVSQNGAKLLQAVVTVQSGIGSGSGFYIGQDGYLLTNHHVVADSKFVKIKLADGRSLVGEVVRQDKLRDLALIRTDPVNTAVLSVRREEPGIGEEVYALGSPFGDVLSGTLTRGVLSSRRVIEGTAFLQSDVAVNPGNSGGPLIDSTGRVIGITQISFRGAQGINLFIPIAEALEKLHLTVQPSP